MLLAVVTPLSLGGYERENENGKKIISSIRFFSSSALWCFGLVESILTVSLLWTVTEGIEDGEPWLMGAAVTTSIGALAKWCLLFGMLWASELETMKIVKERSELLVLLSRGEWAEAAELILFKMGNLSAACKALYVEFLRRAVF